MNSSVARIDTAMAFFDDFFILKDNFVVYYNCTSKIYCQSFNHDDKTLYSMSSK